MDFYEFNNCRFDRMKNTNKISKISDLFGPVGLDLAVRGSLQLINNQQNDIKTHQNP